MPFSFGHHRAPCGLPGAFGSCTATSTLIAGALNDWPNLVQPRPAQRSVLVLPAQTANFGQITRRFGTHGAAQKVLSFVSGGLNWICGSHLFYCVLDRPDAPIRFPEFAGIFR